MKLKNFIEGINIVWNTMSDEAKEKAEIQFEHDQTWFGYDSTELTISDEKKEELDKLGFFEDEESWSCFS